MKKITAILAATVAGATISGAEELSISTTFSWESDYIFRGVQLAEEYFAPSVDISYGGAYFGIWAALPVDAQFANEVDYYAGYGFALSDTVSADVGFTYYQYPEGSDDFFGDDDSFELYGGLSFDAPAAPAIYVFYDFDYKYLTIEGSVGHSVELSEEGAVDFGAYLGYADPDNGDDWNYYGASVAYSYAFTENASFSIGLNWYGCSEDTIGYGRDANGALVPDDDNAFSISTSFTAGF